MNKKEKSWAAGGILLGTVLGVVGSLLAGVFDRQFVRFGTWYDLSIVVFFFITVWWLDRFFNKLIDRE